MGTNLSVNYDLVLQINNKLNNILVKNSIDVRKNHFCITTS